MPHVTDAIQDWIERVAKIPVDESGLPPDVCIVEVRIIFVIERKGVPKNNVPRNSLEALLEILSLLLLSKPFVNFNSVSVMTTFV